jgi:predicted membrane channel-forming protein YqfA (hemolysin III family)
MINKISIVVFIIGVIVCVVELYLLVPYALSDKLLTPKAGLHFFIYITAMLFVLVAPSINKLFLTKE